MKGDQLQRNILVGLLAVCWIYFPSNAESPKFVIATYRNLTHKVILPCNVSRFSDGDKAENIEVVWNRDGVELAGDNLDGFEVDQKGGSLTIESFHTKYAGDYECVIKQNGDVLDTKPYNLRMEPFVKRFEKSRNLVEEDSLTLSCVADGSPLPTLQWFKQKEGEDKEVLVSAGRVSFTARKDGSPNATNAVLKIANLNMDDDRGYYSCVATATIDGVTYNKTSTILIRVKDKLAALWPFLGICAEVAILCIIIFIYEKRRSKNDDDDDLDAKEEMNKNAADHKPDATEDAANKEELRQRSNVKV